MKIAIIGANRPDSMEFHLENAFNHAGHCAEVFDIYDSKLFSIDKLRPIVTAIDKSLRTYNDSYDERRFISMLPKINSFAPDIVICLYKDIHPTLVDRLKKINRKVVHLNPDAMTTLGYQQVFAGKYDAWFTKDPYMLDLMKHNMHLNVFPYTEAFNQRYNPKPQKDKAISEQETRIDVATYGTLYPYRNRMLGEIVKAGVDITLFGVVPHRFFDTNLAKYCTGKYIRGEEKARVLYGAKIVLNTLHFAEVESVNCRFFETNGCGAFQLCDYRPILKNLLPKGIDPDLVSYKSTDEAIDKIKYYLSNPLERYEIADIVYKHFIGNYTYDHLAQYLLSVINQL